MENHSILEQLEHWVVCCCGIIKSKYFRCKHLTFTFGAGWGEWEILSLLSDLGLVLLLLKLMGGEWPQSCVLCLNILSRNSLHELILTWHRLQSSKVVVANLWHMYSKQTSRGTDQSGSRKQSRGWEGTNLGGFGTNLWHTYEKGCPPLPVELGLLTWNASWFRWWLCCKVLYLYIRIKCIHKIEKLSAMRWTKPNITCFFKKNCRASPTASYFIWERSCLEYNGVFCCCLFRNLSLFALG